MKKPPTPKQIIEGKEPNELTDLLEMEAPKEPLEKAWEDLKETTEKWNKEALKAMDTWETSKGETPTENWIEELYKIWNDKTTLIEISEFIAQLLLTQRQERLSRQDLTTPYLVGFKEGKEEACKEILGMIEGMNYKLNVDEYLPLVESWDRKNFDVPFDHGYKQAKADLSHRIEERYGVNKEIENQYKPFLLVTNKEGTAMLYAKDFNSATNGTLEKWMSLEEERYKSE